MELWNKRHIMCMQSLLSDYYVDGKRHGYFLWYNPKVWCSSHEFYYGEYEKIKYNYGLIIDKLQTMHHSKCMESMISLMPNGTNVPGSWRWRSQWHPLLYTLVRDYICPSGDVYSGKLL